MTAPGGPGSIATGVQYGVTSGNGSLPGLAGRTQDGVIAQMQAEMQGSPSWKGASQNVFGGIAGGLPGLFLAFVRELIGDAEAVFETLEEGFAAAAAFVANIADDAATVAVAIEDAIAKAVAAAITDAASVANTAVNEGFGFLTNVLRNIIQLLGLVGNPTVGSAGGITVPGVNSGQLTLTQLLGALTTDQQISPSQLQSLASQETKNVLADPSFDTGSFIQGQGRWCWDGWVGTGAFAGINASIRTVRPGVITIYNVIGTSQGIFNFPVMGQGPIPINVGGDGIVLEYLRNEQYGWLVDWVLKGTDPIYFEWINVPYPAAQYPMGASVYAGAQWLMNAINEIPGPFFFVLDSQGNQVGAAVYDELRFGKMQDRRNDFLGAIAIGNLRREQGHTFPGYPDPAPGTAGMCDVSLMTTGPYAGSGNPADPTIGNLVDTEDLWWDFCQAGDYFACTPVNGVTQVPPDGTLGGNVGCIAGIPGYQLREFYTFINQAYNGSNNIIGDVIAWTLAHGIGGSLNILTEFMGAVYQQISALAPVDSPHNTYHISQPFLDRGDTRTFFEIGIDYINSFIAGSHPDGTPIRTPPVNGERHQLLGQRVAVKPFQVVRAGAQVMWVNVAADGPAIIVAVNAYDKNENLIATVTSDECVISDPEPSSNWAFIELVSDFVMPEGTATACIVLDVEPDAMRTGIVWFDDCKFEPESLFDAGWLDVTNIPQLAGVKLAGPQGQADMLTAWQNLIDNLASANSQTNVTGAQLTQMLQAAGLTAQNAQLAYELGVSNHQILSNVATQPYWASMQPSGQVTFSLPRGTLPTVTIPMGTTLMGYINTAPAIPVGFVEFLAKSSGTPTGIYLNLYTMDPTTGDLTNVYTSADISAEISTGALDWAPISIPSDKPQLALAQGVFWEIVAQGHALTVVADTIGGPNKSYMIPPNIGATRTTLATGGVSPATLSAATDLAFGGTAPFVCMSVTDLPPTYFPPNEKEFTSAGTSKYPIPTWVLDGDVLDLVGVAGGGAGGWADGNICQVNNGQGGQPGSWDSKSLNYGTDIPGGTTELDVIVGHGGSAPSGAGSNTLIGYGFDSPPTFDADADGDSGAGVTSISWTHDAEGGAYVVVGLYTTWGTFDVTYDGMEMIPLGLVYVGGIGTVGALCFYGIADAPPGTSFIMVNTAQAAWMSGNSLSFNNVSCAGLVTDAYGTATDTLTHDVICGENQLIVHAFGNQGYAQQKSFSGGTNRAYNYVPNGNYYSDGISLSYATESTTFGAKLSVQDNWGALSLVLNPAGTVLLSTTGGQPGGPGGAGNFNPANPNATSNGPGPGNKKWAGKLRAGGPDATALSYPGNPPGGAASGGNQSTNPTGPAFAGGDGRAWITAKRGASSINMGGGLGGGGSELAVAYEATGVGANNVGGNTLSWAHDSDGGPNCAVVLLGAVDYSSGAASISATYGSTSFVYNLDGLTYYNSGGIGIFIFALGIIGVPSGTQNVTLSATNATINDLAGNTLSYQNVGAFGDFQTSSGNGTGLSLPNISSAAGQMVVGGFAAVNAVLGSFSPSQRWQQANTASIPMVIGDSNGASSVSFLGSGSASNPWGAVGGVLIPIS
ncbi:hypothetical protein AAHS21_23705 [Mycobacterium sp. 050272]|uniref:hypothetical protein n=1 Tax=Mycobacterium sp. 050272 TaxID=3142488 RepID=UPI00319958AA